jgi:hypothetical protein
VAVTLPQHLWIRGRDAVHNAADVDVDDRVPLIEGEQLGVAAPDDARVVEEQVQTSGPRHDVVDHGLYRVAVGDVQRHRPGP